MPLKLTTQERVILVVTLDPGSSLTKIIYQVIVDGTSSELKILSMQPELMQVTSRRIEDYFELAQPLGEESRDHLKSIIQQNGDRVTLKIVDTDRYGRRVAEVFTGGKFLQAEQVRSGMAYVYEKYLNNCPDAAVVKQAEAIAQQKKIGVWSGNYQKPWDYRKRER